MLGLEQRRGVPGGLACCARRGRADARRRRRGAVGRVRAGGRLVGRGVPADGDRARKDARSRRRALARARVLRGLPRRRRARDRGPWHRARRRGRGTPAGRPDPLSGSGRPGRRMALTSSETAPPISASRKPSWRWASASSATHSVAVGKATRWPARRGSRTRSRGGLPVPGGPSSTTFSRPGRKSSWPRCWISVVLTERWNVKSNSSSVLRAGKRAALMRPSPPCASREAYSVDSGASAKPGGSRRSIHAGSPGASCGSSARAVSGSSAGSIGPTPARLPAVDVECSRMALSPLECRSVRSGPI
jgi:hypothetical protein